MINAQPRDNWFVTWHLQLPSCLFFASRKRISRKQSWHWYPHIPATIMAFAVANPIMALAAKTSKKVNQLAGIIFFPHCHSSNIEFLARCEGHGILTSFVRDLRGHFLWHMMPDVGKGRPLWRRSESKKGVPSNWKFFWHKRNGCDVQFWMFFKS